MNTTHHFISMLPSSSSFQFNHNHQEFNEDATTSTISLSASIDKNKNFLNNDQLDEFHREFSFYNLFY